MSNQVVMPLKGSKYKNVKIEVDGILFDSKGEANRYVTLRIAHQSGIIEALRTQVPFKLEVNGILICTYIADFVYKRDGKMVCEDFKGVLTDVFKLKAKLMKAICGIDILITRKPTAYSEIGKRKPKLKK